MTQPLRTILVANRGEIALRVMRSARALGRRCVAVYSTADAAAPHVSFADVAIPLAGAELAASYLNVAAILNAARVSGADAIHPGYGLLSENAAFAQACAAAGFTFIGPSPEAIALMGDKRRARIAVAAAGVPCVPGYDAEDQSDATLVREAERIGFPLMVKARAGGGGRGMRRVAVAADLPEALRRARSESLEAFGDDALILERVIEDARHVELQIFGDTQGNVIHLGERDCSAQRRFQKILEEAPSPAVDDALRARMGEVAVRAAQSTRYVGAGTVEFLLGPDREFYFLEMNTRLQVEHPVTELVTGLDLVALQIRVADGEPLPIAQHELRIQGHAIEARLYAEDPARGFVPDVGRVRLLRVPDGEGVRVDHGLAPELAISPHYDPMLAKVIAHGATREEARLRLGRALSRLRVLGLATNQRFLCDVLEHERFVRGQLTTAAIERSVIAELPKPVLTRASLVAAALVFVARETEHGELRSFSNATGLSWPITLAHRDATHLLRVEPLREANRYRVHVAPVANEAGTFVAGLVAEHGAFASTLVIDGVRNRFDHAFDGAQLWLHTPEGSLAFRDVTHAAREATEQGSGRALAPMEGAIVDVPVRVGQTVACGDTLAVVSAMKLELRVVADLAGVVAEVHVARGDQVKARQLLVRVAAPAPVPAS